MRTGRLSVSLGAILLGALLYSALSFYELAALLAPVLVHELGHLLMLRLFGLRVRGFRFDLRGLCIEYGGYAEPFSHGVAAFAGPAAGLAYAFAASYFARRCGNGALALSAGVSLLLSLFNLLPVLPLDGGRIFSLIADGLLGAKKGARLTAAVGLALSSALLVCGLYVMWRGEGTALLLAALWLLLAQPDKAILVNHRELL